LNIFKEIIAKFPQHPLADDVRYELGACYYLSDLDTIDVPLYFKSLKVRSDTFAAKITYMITRCYLDRGLAELAEYYYQKVADQYSQSRFADDALIILAYDEKDYLRSIPKYQKVIMAYPQSDEAKDAAYKIAQLLFRTEQYDIAVNAWKRYLSSYSSITYYY
jgi:TolA-binding protein